MFGNILDKYHLLYAPETEAGSEATATETIPPPVVTEGAEEDGAVTTTTAETEQIPPTTIPKERFDAVVAQRWQERSRAETEANRAKLLETNLGELQRRIASLPAEVQQQIGLTAPTAGQTATTSPTATYTREQVEQYVQAEAASRAFNEKCNAVAEEGKKKFTDFDSSLSDLRRMSPFDPSSGQQVLPVSLVEAAFETDDPAEALYLLGKDPTEAERIISLSPTKQVAALLKFTGRKAEKTTTPGNNLSKAPPPITPAVGAGSGTTTTVDLADKRTPIDRWMEERTAQVESKKKAR